jgi:hypothetical protein
MMLPARWTGREMGASLSNDPLLLHFAGRRRPRPYGGPPPRNRRAASERSNEHAINRAPIRGRCGATFLKAASCVDGPQLARVIFAKSTGRLQSCVRPFGAVAHDRWP